MTLIRRALRRVPHHVWRPFIISVVVIIIGLQFVRPAIKNTPVIAELKAPPQVRQILRTAVTTVIPTRLNLPGSIRSYLHTG